MHSHFCFSSFLPCPGDGRVSVCVAAGQGQPTTSSRNIRMWSDMENIKTRFFMAHLYLDFMWIKQFYIHDTYCYQILGWYLRALNILQSDNTGEGESNCPVDTAGFVFILTETWLKNFTFLLSNPCLLVINSFHQHHSSCLSFLSLPPQNRMVVIILKLSRNIFRCGFSPVMDIASKHKAIRDTL